MTKQSKQFSNKPTCKFCGKQFSRETTLAVHMCEKKRRYEQRNESGPRIGLSAYQQFYTSTAGGKPKTMEDFMASNYYKAFVKFGWYVHQIRAVDPPQLVDWLLANKVKLDWWTKDRYYEKYMVEFMKKENPESAITRTIKELGRWADENDSEIDQFFTVASNNKIANMIANGRLSPWFLFNCDQGVAILEEFNEDQISLAFKWIDPNFWTSKFEKYAEDVIWIRELLGEAGFNEGS